MLDSPALIDLGHGTVRYRLPDEKREHENTKVKTGYFYHPRLDDFSEGTLYGKLFSLHLKCIFHVPMAKHVCTLQKLKNINPVS